MENISHYDFASVTTGDELHILDANENNKTNNSFVNMESSGEEIILYGAPVVLYFGTFGSLISLFTFMKMAPKLSSYSILFVLSFMDFLVLFFGLFQRWLELSGYTSLQMMSDVSCKGITFLTYLCWHLSIWLIVTLTTERFLKIWYPVWRARFCGVMNVCLVMYSLVFILSGVNIHFLWTVTVADDTTNATRCVAATTYTVFIYEVWPVVDVIVYYILPLGCILTMNSGMIYKIRNRNQQRLPYLQKLPVVSTGGRRQNVKRNKNITAVTMAVSCCFLVTTFPVTAIQIYGLSRNSVSSMQDSKSLMKLKYMAELLMYVTHSMNFIFYYILEKDFRAHFYKVFCKNSNNSSESEPTTL